MLARVQRVRSKRRASVDWGSKGPLLVERHGITAARFSAYYHRRCRCCCFCSCLLLLAAVASLPGGATRRAGGTVNGPQYTRRREGPGAPARTWTRAAWQADGRLHLHASRALLRIPLLLGQCDAGPALGPYKQSWCRVPTWPTCRS